MTPTVRKYGLLAITAFLTFAFGAAGLSKLAGVEMMVATFDAIGWGQWFRYVTGIIEVASAILIWVPGKQWIGAALLVCTMTCAVAFHLLVLGPSLIPALVLGILAAIILIARRPD
jgi:putative oxidoreductase